MLRAAELGMIIIVDGFIMTSRILAASQLYPEVMDYAVFGHQGGESGHKLMPQTMGVKALLHLDLRLGENRSCMRLPDNRIGSENDQPNGLFRMRQCHKILLTALSAMQPRP